MPEKATVSHRGEKYEIGRGKRFYGIWAVGAPYSDPVDRWPETREGWEQAWTRFVAIETPGSIAAVPGKKPALPRLRKPRPAGETASETTGETTGGTATATARRRLPGPLAGAALLALGVVLGLAGLFPGYFGGQSLASQAEQLVPHVLQLAGWTVSAGLIAGAALRGDGGLPGGRPLENLSGEKARVYRTGRARTGALLGAGLSAVTFGLFLADLGEVVSGGASLGTGLVLTLLGWLACAAGSALALGRVRLAGRAGQAARDDGPGRPTRSHAGQLGLLLLAGIGTAVAFAPSWDSYTLNVAANGGTQTVTAGNAFANPGMVIAGDVLVMVAIVAVAALAALWRPARHGGMLLAGAIVPVAAQAISALIQVSQPATPAMFNISQAQASALGLTIASGVTPVFWVYCVFVISLVVSCAWLFTAPPHQVLPGMPAAPWFPAPSGDQPADRPADRPAGDATSGAFGEAGKAAPDSDGGAGDGEQSAYA